MSRREYFSYDGTTCIGRFVVDEKTGEAKAFNGAGRLLGEFPTYDAARTAVSEAHHNAVAYKARAAAAMARLSEPVTFVSGLPPDGGGRRRP